MTYAKKFLYSLIPVFLMIVVMLYTGAQAGGDKDIVIKLELAPNIETVQSLLAPYDEAHIQWLRLNTQLDFVFILTYSFVFFFAISWWLDKFTQTDQWNQIPFLAFVPGILDVIENNFILVFLRHDFGTAYFNYYYWCVHIKWGLVPAMLVPSLGLLGLLIFKKARGLAVN